jgi:hypothetical protein
MGRPARPAVSVHPLRARGSPGPSGSRGALAPASFGPARLGNARARDGPSDATRSIRSIVRRRLGRARQRQGLRVARRKSTAFVRRKPVRLRNMDACFARFCSYKRENLRQAVRLIFCHPLACCVVSCSLLL